MPRLWKGQYPCEPAISMIGVEVDLFAVDVNCWTGPLTSHWFSMPNSHLKLWAISQAMKHWSSWHAELPVLKGNTQNTPTALSPQTMCGIEATPSGIMYPQEAPSNRADCSPVSTMACNRTRLSSYLGCLFMLLSKPTWHSATRHWDHHIKENPELIGTLWNAGQDMRSALTSCPWVCVRWQSCHGNIR